MPDSPLLLGPILRHVDTTTATVWVETRRAGRLEVRAGDAAGTAASFQVAGHHYALVVVRGLAAGSTTAYDVRLDGDLVWPRPDDPLPVPVIRTLPDPPDPDHRLDIVFGSCRVDRPHDRPYTLTADEHPDGVGVDALVALALECRRGRPLPDLVVMLGDQVYADEGLSPSIRARQVERRGEDSDPVAEVADFEEYTWLYHESWGDPNVRWLLSTVPSTMIFDDHDVRDDWNTSHAWRQEMDRLPWWRDRIVGAYLSYWLYQHLGNLSPDTLDRDDLWTRVREQTDATDLLRDFAARADDEVDGRKQSLWSYDRQLGRSRLVVVDTRSGRLLEGDCREMLSADEWERVEGVLTGDVDHLLVAASLPLVMERAIHDLEAWDEAVAEGHAYRGRLQGLGEKLRQAADLEHWAAFEDSFRRLVELLGDVAAGRRGAAPASVLVLSGDVHHSYVAPLRYPADGGVRAPVVQLVSSPMRNAFPRSQQRNFEWARTRPARLLGRALRRSAGLPAVPVRWRVTAGPLFGNGVAVLGLRGRSASVRFEKSGSRDGGDSGAFLRVEHDERLV